MGASTYSETKKENVFGKSFMKWIEATDFDSEEEKTQAIMEIQTECINYLVTVANIKLDAEQAAEAKGSTP